MKTWYCSPNLPRTKKCFYFVFTALLLMIVSACGSDDGDDLSISLDGPVLSISDISGNWNATNAVIESIDGSNLRIALVEEGGSATLSIASNGRFTLNLGFPGQPSEVISGEFGFNESEYGDRLIVIADGDPREDYEVFNILLQNGVLSLNGQFTFDFLGNGSEIPASLDLTMIRG